MVISSGPRVFASIAKYGSAPVVWFSLVSHAGALEGHEFPATQPRVTIKTIDREVLDYLRKLLS